MDLVIRTYAFLAVTATNLKDRLADEDRGQTALEYILVLALVAIVVFALTQSEIGSRAQDFIDTATEALFEPSN